MALDVQLYSFGLDYGAPSWRPIRPLTFWKLVPDQTPAKTPVQQVRSFSDFYFLGSFFLPFFLSILLYSHTGYHIIHKKKKKNNNKKI
jgi:hypothetical protein